MAQARRNAEWDLNDWNWDGHLFVATPLNGSPSRFKNPQRIPSTNMELAPNSSLSCSGDSEPGISDRVRRESEKRRREKEDETDDFSGSLTLKLGGLVYPVEESRDTTDWDAKNSKRSKMQGGNLSGAVCQVEGCGVDLSGVKDYYRRHKVCEMHAKSSKATVGSVQQRFCQQCSRFHLLEEFDEGKRSCRRRLAGHNRRRRKPQPNTVVTGTSPVDDRTSSYLLISLLRILTNLHTGNAEQVKDNELLIHLLKNLGSLSGHVDWNNLNGSLKSTQGRPNPGSSAGTSEPVQEINPDERFSLFSRKQTFLPNLEGVRIRNFDLNDTYNDQESDHLFVPESQRQDFSHPLPWAMKKSDKNILDSTFSEHVQNRTDRIVFKLFGKDPSDFPLSLRRQILEWLSNSPSDIEGYIRPGCLILTIYLRLKESSWHELSHSLKSSLEKLLAVAESDEFWKSGWVYSRIQHQMAFILNGRVVLDTPAFFNPHSHCDILSISPLAISTSEEVRFTVKGLNLTRSTRVLCAFDGKYLAQESTHSLSIAEEESQQVQCLHFFCSVPSGMGRGFVEVEDHALRSSTFPFIVAEEAVAAEIRTLETAVNVDFDFQTSGSNSRERALDFLHEMGWLLRKANLGSDSSLYPLAQFRFLIDFSVDQNWSAVVNKLLDFFFSEAVAVNSTSDSIELILSELSLLHRAVQNNRTSTVELLLTYVPRGKSTEEKSVGQRRPGFLFRPDVMGPFGVTPLHIAASRDDSEDVLDALTNDPGQVGIEAWTNARDSSGFTPEDYARLRGHESYIQLVHNKMLMKVNHAVDVPPMTTCHLPLATTFNIERKREDSLPVTAEVPHCRVCLAQWHRSGGSVSRCRGRLGYRPTVLLMVGIATVCVCVGLLLHSPPEVSSITRPFRWEMLSYGYI